MSAHGPLDVKKPGSIGLRLRRSFERQLVGAAMSAAAWPLERAVLRSTRTREESQ